MAEKRILLESGKTYHIWTHANGKDNLFCCEDNFHFFLKKYQFYITPIADTFAYCLMPNHLHLMVRIKSKEDILDFVRIKKDDPSITLQGLQTLGSNKSNQDLTGFGNLSGLGSKQFSNLFNSYTKAFNKQYDRKGSLFTRGFHRKYINSDEYFVRLIAYIHNNPIKHGFVKHPGDWPHSSWHAYVSKRPTKINKAEAMTWFGDTTNFYSIHAELNHQNLLDLFED